MKKFSGPHYYNPEQCSACADIEIRYVERWGNDMTPKPFPKSGGAYIGLNVFEETNTRPSQVQHREP